MADLPVVQDPPQRQCRNCKYWDDLPDEDFPICRFFPPRQTMRGNPIWPTPCHDDWCGQFSPKLVAVEKGSAAEYSVHVAGIAANVGSRSDEDFAPPDERTALRCFVRQDIPALMGDHGHSVLPAPTLICDACQVARYELMAVGPEFAICSVCYGGVTELHHLRHGAEFCQWRAKGQGRTKSEKAGRLTDPPTSQEVLRVYRRDSFTCRYCEEKAGDLTVDHIDPEGGNSMENFATACRSCNSKKGRRTPDQAGMVLIDE